MKKLIIVLILLFAATAVFAQSINLGQFPVGKWLDSNYNAIWEFSSNNVKIVDSKTGEVYFEFAGQIQDFKVGASGGLPPQPVVSFSCSATGRAYSFKTTLPSTDLILEIDRPNLPKYSVTMKKQ